MEPYQNMPQLYSLTFMRSQTLYLVQQTLILYRVNLQYRGLYPKSLHALIMVTVKRKMCTKCMDYYCYRARSYLELA